MTTPTDKIKEFKESDEQPQISKKIASDWFDAVNKILTHDHSHCWTEEKPPCGQRIKHFECCICKGLNPEIVTTKQELLSGEGIVVEDIIHNVKEGI